jgi:hypothetical protein
MPPNSQTESHSGYAAAGFEPVALDVDTLDPDAYPGQYEAVCDGVKYQPTKKTGAPMLRFDWKLKAVMEDSSDGNCEKSLGRVLSDYIVIGAVGFVGNKGKLALRHFRDECGVELPASIASPEDLDELRAAMKGQTLPLWITVRKDNDGNERANINYFAPRGGGSDMEPMEEIDEPAAPKRAAASSKGHRPAPAKKPARR